MKNRETLAASVLKKHLPSTDMTRIENEIVKAMLEFSDLETIQGPKRITRERLIDLASQLEGVLDKSPTIYTPVTTTVDPQTEYKRSEPEKAVKPAPVNTEKAVKQTEAGLVNETLITCIKSPKL